MIGLFETIFYQNVIIASRDAAILSITVGLVLLIVGNRIPPVWRHGLWLLIAVRLFAPVLPGSFLSWQNVIPTYAWDIAPPFQTSQQVEVGQTLSAPVSDPLRSVRKPSFEAPSMMQIFALIWMSGLALILSITSFQYWRFSKQVRRLRDFDSRAINRVTDLLNQLVKQGNLHRTPAILITDGVSSPAVTGIFRQVILLPRKLITTLSDEEISFVLRHELAHFQRHDVWTNWLLTILQAVHWFNPIIWWAFRRTRIEAECATDVRVMQNLGHVGATNYGSALIRILEHTSAKTGAAIPGVIGIAESRRELKKRISLISSFTGKRRRLGTVTALALFMAMAGFGLTQAPKEERRASASSSTESTANILKASLPEVEFRDQPLRKVLKWLESKFPENGPKFVVDGKVDQSREITLVMSNAPIAEVLRFSTNLTSTQYRIDGSSILISPASGKSAGTGRPARSSGGNNIRGPSIQFRNDLPVYPLSPKLKEIASDYLISEFTISNKTLSAAIAQLVELSKTIDPDGDGVEISVSEGVVQNKALQFTLKKVSILSVTEYMARAFGAVTTIKNGKVVIVPDKNPDEAPVMRVWNVLPNKFAGNDPKEVLRTAGVEFPEGGGSAILYAEDRNQLIIRHSKAYCDKVEAWLINTKTMAPR
ncbi:MAG: M56 family metallopeptidase [Verrucomicrobiales bacterium]|nr:M56 family metallopeptidase [Verrucomicrobiales bacterium]